MSRGRPRDKNRRGSITTANAPKQLKGDHGPNTEAQRAGTVLIPVENDPNGTERRVRVNWVEEMKGELTARQYQAAIEIQNAYWSVQSLSSGNSDYSRPIGDSTPRSDKFTDAQASKVTRYRRATDAIPSAMWPVVEWVVIKNRPSVSFNEPEPESMVKAGLDLAANRLGF